MLDEVIQIVKKSSFKIEGSTLLCHYQIENIELIKRLFENELIDNVSTSIDELKNEDFCDLEFPIIRLQKLGLYINFNQFVLNNRYTVIDDSIYILDRDCFLKDSELFNKCKILIELIDELKSNSKHNYADADIDNIIIVREDKSLFMSLDYESKIIESLDDKKVSQLYNFIEVIKDSNFKDKKNIFLNELIEFCTKFDEDIRFSSLINNFDSFINNALSTYDFYLRNFSYNKMKLEIDSKAIEFNQKLQGVINDSQTKLIAIPAAFVLVLSSLDYGNTTSPKNIISVCGLFIFSGLLQLFVNNQKSTIKFIEENVDHYKSTFKNQDKKEVEKTFNRVNNEKNKQYERLILIEVIIWFIPLFTACMLFFLSDFQLMSVLILFFFTWVASNKLLLKY